jgi:hypothetical protein
MAELQYNKNIFPNVNKISFDGTTYSYNGILIASKLNQKNGQGYRLLDAIDIDWNGAWVSSLNTYLNSTEDLVQALNDLNANSGVDELNKDLERVWNQINEITASYITHTILGEILSSYQNTLIAGDNITITNNVITTYNLPTYTFLEENYLSNYKFGEYKNYITANYYTKTDTVDKIYEITKEKIDEVINGADSAFDTLKEIADWILEQNRYELVEPQYVIDNWEKYEFFTKDEETGKYIKVEKVEDVITDGSVQYYKLENYLTDIKELIEDVDKLEETVGYSYVNMYGELSYTGILGDVKQIQQDVVRIDATASEALRISSRAENTANEALEQSGIAYDMAYSGYVMAETAYGMAYEGYVQADLAYGMAYSSYVAVGQPSYVGRGWIEINFEDITTYQNDGNKIYYFDNDLLKYNEITENFEEGTQYFINEPSITGTGLTKRIEDAEEDILEIQEELGNINTDVASMLYNLHVDNTYSSYVKLSLSPDEYNGDSNRTIHIETIHSSFNPETGEVTVPGIPDISTICNIYTYASSWQFLGYDE